MRPALKEYLLSKSLPVEIENSCTFINPLVAKAVPLFFLQSEQWQWIILVIAPVIFTVTSPHKHEPVYIQLPYN
ncbi:hypothetical protein CZ797_16830 [Pseudoalteromonas sp. JB197]|nr:hypothetical protein CZ797_16830 [Pseudoalteromonas sp. JB197]